MGSKEPVVSAEESARLAQMSPKEAFGEVMGDLAQSVPTLTVVVADYGRRLNLERMRRTLPEGYVQCGIAEQNQVEVASALANEGFTVFVPCYATFVTGRALDQVRVNLGMMHSPVMLVGVSAGCESGMLGASHMALEDVSFMRSIPGMSVYCPADNAELAAVLRMLAAEPRPAYVRVDSLDGVNLHPAGMSGWPRPVELLHAATGGADVAGDVGAGGANDGSGATALGDGAASGSGAAARGRVTIVATGPIASRAVEAARLLEEHGVSTEVLEELAVKPLAPELSGALATSAASATSGVRCLVVTLEEHSVIGGLGGAVAELLSGIEGAPALLRLGMPDRYLAADSQQALLERAGLTPRAIAKSVLERLEQLG